MGPGCVLWVGAPSLEGHPGSWTLPGPSLSSPWATTDESHVLRTEHSLPCLGKEFCGNACGGNGGRLQVSFLKSPRSEALCVTLCVFPRGAKRRHLGCWEPQGMIRLPLTVLEAGRRGPGVSRPPSLLLLQPLCGRPVGAWIALSPSICSSHPSPCLLAIASASSSSYKDTSETAARTHLLQPDLILAADICTSLFLNKATG